MSPEPPTVDVAEALKDSDVRLRLKLARMTPVTNIRLRIGMAVFELGLRIAGFIEGKIETENGAGDENQSD